MNWRRLTKLYAVFFSPFAMAALTLFVILAFLSGDWEVTLVFNDYGEGMAELVLIPASFLVSVTGTVWLVRDRYI